MVFTRINNIFLFVVLLGAVLLQVLTKNARKIVEESDEEDSLLQIYSSSDKRNQHLHIFSVPRRSWQSPARYNERRHSKPKKKSSLPSRRSDDSDTDSEIENRAIAFGGDIVHYAFKVQIKDFNFKTCDNSENDPIKVHYLKLLSDPILPGVLNVKFNITTLVNLAAPIQGEVQVYKKVGPTEIKLPCVFDIGSCTYRDMCEMSQYGRPCPSYFLGIPCGCPFSRGTYSINDLPLYLKLTEVDQGVGIPAWLTNGSYRGQITFKSGGKRLGCFQASLKAEKVM